MLSYQILQISAMAIIIANSGLKTFLKKAAVVFFKKELKRVKPFDCALCLSFWISLYLYQDVLLSFGIALLTETLYRLFKLIPLTA